MSPRFDPPKTPIGLDEAPSKIPWDAREDGYSLLPFVIHEPIEWRPTDEEDVFELWIPTQDRWRRIKDHWLPVLEGLEEAQTLREVHDYAIDRMPDRPASHIRYIIRKVASGLVRWEMAEVVLPAVPEVFEERYERIDELGRGGMGIVWRCRDLGHPDEREVAVKHAWNWNGRLSRRDDKLREEAGLMAKADHPGIATYFDEFEIDGRFHLVRELLAGPSLGSYISRVEPALQERARILREIVSSLIHLRELGYLCLDVKAGNYMLDGPSGSAKLVDLGLCKELKDGRVQASGMPGTRSYQDPVLLKEDYATEQSSVYAVGRILWRMIVGRRPKPRAHYESYFEQHDLDLARMEEADASEAERSLFEAACSPVAEDRPPTLEAFRDRLPS